MNAFRDRRIWMLPVIVAACVTVFGAATALNGQQQGDNGEKTAEAQARARDLSTAFKHASNTVSPAVVHIRSSRELDESATSRRSPFDEEFFRRFFGDVPDDFFNDDGDRPRVRIGQGTGVIVREDGIIVTNNHVVDGATDISVLLPDDREYDAEIVGTDAESDLAVIRIDASDLPAAKLGESDSLEVGEWVLAIGSPFGLQRTVTAGIVSATGRSGMGLATFEDFIQTDAAINPGNSGGPLVNLDGDVVGINTAISTRTGGYMGIGFAIPSSMVSGVLESILETGRVQRGWLGVSIQPLTEGLANSFGYDSTRGVLLAGVFDGSPAAEAGLEPGDIVVRIDGQRMNDTTELLNTVAESGPGEKISLEIFRNGETMKRTVELAERTPERLAQRGTMRQPSPPSATTELGMRVQPLTRDLARRLGAEDVEGVVIARVVPNSIAARAGMSQGDIVTRIGDQNVSSIDEFTKAFDNIDLAEGVRMHVYRAGATRFVFLEKPEDD
jgi:serine protease Do